MVQTIQQRKANQKFAKGLEGKMGKPKQDIEKKQTFKSPISPFWLGVLGFVIFGGLVFEAISRIFF